MENQVLFQETQRFKQWWLWLILLIVNASGVWFLTEKYVQHKNFADTAYHSNAGAEVWCIITFLVSVLILNINLETLIYTNKIKVRLFPFHLKFKTFSAEMVGQAYVRKYSAIGEYGGWGLRYGLSAKGKAYNISGNQGIQLVLKDGSWLLIGTKKPEEASVALQLTRFPKM